TARRAEHRAARRGRSGAGCGGSGCAATVGRAIGRRGAGRRGIGEHRLRRPGDSARGAGLRRARRRTRERAGQRVRVYLLVLLTAAAVTFLATPLVRRLALLTGAITPVRDRDVHATPIPRLGGVAMLAGLAVALLVGSQVPFLDDVFFESGTVWAILAGAAIICLLGVLDDIWDLDWMTKLVGQVLAAGFMAWNGVQLITFPVFGVTMGSSRLSLIATIFVVVVAINAVNFVDGLDGLAAGMIAIGGGAFFVYSYLLTQAVSPGDYSN